MQCVFTQIKVGAILPSSSPCRSYVNHTDFPLYLTNYKYVLLFVTWKWGTRSFIVDIIIYNSKHLSGLPWYIHAFILLPQYFLWHGIKQLCNAISLFTWNKATWCRHFLPYLGTKRPPFRWHANAAQRVSKILFLPLENKIATLIIYHRIDSE